MYGLLSCHVLAGDGRSLATVALRAVHSTTTSATPIVESRKFTRAFFIGHP
jgi:hypothetical protein